MEKFEDVFVKEKYILMEGALSERLKREYNILGDKDIALAGHIYNENKKQALAELFKQYLNIAKKYDMSIMITTPTRRANKDRVSNSIFNKKNVIEDNVNFLKQLRQETGANAYIGGLMGCKGDAYSKNNHLDKKSAFEFHLWQAKLFKDANVDFLYAGIMPTLPEAIGMAKAMESTGLPYIISFMIKKDGKLLDGTTINDAIVNIDNSINRKPLCYMTNCVHPEILNSALAQEFNVTSIVKNRFKGIQANTSKLCPEELDNSVELKTSDSISLANDIINLYNKFNLKIFGGCCGTDNTHIEEIAKRLNL
ncbi:homocysteine S-methyltransferase family protein [Clostridium saccharobutylicum]|uniref:Homocysteine methyltransferase n=1 Tax=Clostridium saccharobutylicum TaxID=169679 RepID=A0A1S8MTC2_CLOSA|nr:homocysteine S-methyltransferase family protein [Clostridium saccharobutylicum]OOM07418.1 homocysteine methyltransferase [Clostridium saccharobutylicum]